MKLDLVHDVQKAYRKLIHSMSRPGTITRFGEESCKFGIKAPCYDATVLLALTLLDTEVTFKVCSKREAEIVKLFNQLTYAKQTRAEEADYLFILHDAHPSDFDYAMRAAKTGDLVDPHASATLIVEAAEITADWELVLTGPGIEKENGLRIVAGGSWLDIRAAKNGEYPMGIDMIFVDREQRAACLPRTTQVRKD